MSENQEQLPVASSAPAESRINSLKVEAVPWELRQRPQWVCWRRETRNGAPTKVPYDVRRARRASTTDPATWHSFEETLRSFQTGAYDGIGYVLAFQDPFCGIDLDQCLDADGHWLWGKELAEWLGTYAEVSPSGRGIKLIGLGKKPRHARCRKQGVEGPESALEIYDHSRFFTITGHVVGSSRPGIADIQVPLNQLCGYLWPVKETVTAAAQPALDASQVERRAISYLGKMPPAISGQGGHNATYAAATALVHGFGLPPARALQILVEHYNPRCQPPWSRNELDHKIVDAQSKPHDRPFRWLAEAEQVSVSATDVDITGLLAKILPRSVTPEPEASVPVDPGPIPNELLAVPGFVSEVMEFTLQTAPYPNRPLAFAGALALQAALAGRKVRDAGNLRTNLQLLALAHSGVGKDWPRKVNARILMECGEQRKLAGKSASGEGIEDRLLQHPIVLKQDDEIDALFENIRDNTEVRYRNQLAMLLELYGEAGSWRAVRDKASCESRIIHQPHLVLLGTTTPTAFYESLSAKMLVKGLIARLTVIEAAVRGRRQTSSWPPLPASIVDVARWWSEFRPPGWGNLCDESAGAPSPLVIPIDPAAEEVIKAFADECDDQYEKAQSLGDEPAMAVWARGVERTTQLALVYACSANHESPTICGDAGRWATAFVRHGILRTMHMLASHFHESDFEANCNALLSLLVKWAKEKGPQEWMPHKVLRKRLKRMDANEFNAAWQANEELGRIEATQIETGGRPTRGYRLAMTQA